MDVYWLEQSEGDVPITDDWLSDSEATRLCSFRVAKRRSDWRLGRWTAKCAIAASLNLSVDPPTLRQIEIIPATTGQPEVVLRARAETVTISISHRNGIAICAIALGGVALGADLEVIETRSDAFIADYFTTTERELIAKTAGGNRILLVSLLWSAKESALKALHVGLRADTRSVNVSSIEVSGHPREDTKVNGTTGFQTRDLSQSTRARWCTMLVQCGDGTIYHGWWRHHGSLVRTIVAHPQVDPPSELTFHSHVATTFRIS